MVEVAVTFAIVVRTGANDIVVGGSIFEDTVVVGIKVEDTVVGGSIFEDTVVVGIKVEDTVVGEVFTFVYPSFLLGGKYEDSFVGGSIVVGVTVVEESGSELTEVTLLRGAAPFEGKVATVALGRAEFFKRVVSGLDDPSEEPQAETTSADTNKNTTERFFIETTFFRMH